MSIPPIAARSGVMRFIFHEGVVFTTSDSRLSVAGDSTSASRLTGGALRNQESAGQWDDRGVERLDVLVFVASYAGWGVPKRGQAVTRGGAEGEGEGSRVREVLQENGTL